MTRLKRGIAAIVLLIVTTTIITAANIKGRVIDGQTREPLIGASVQAIGGNGAITDVDGNFNITGLKEGKYSITVKYVSYKTLDIDGVRTQDHSSRDSLVIEMESDAQKLGEVTVTGMIRRNTDIAMIEAAKVSPVIVNNISAQEIQRTQDNNASEVIRRVPGVSLIDDKFVMVRGLSQRYNNVWINGGAVPSSEADSRAFSFDIIPSSQIDNLVIVKSPSPEYPADFSGGFIQINTKDIPSKNSISVSVGGNWNDVTAFSLFKYAKGSGTDFLGFDNGLRSFNGGLDASMSKIQGVGIDLLKNGLNNDWTIKDKHPAGDIKLGASISQRWNLGKNQLGMIGALNYTNEYRTFKDMQNNLYGVYDESKGNSNYLRHSTDNQYNHNVRLGAMLNFTFLSASGNNKYELKNIFNQLGNDRYTYRKGVSAQSNLEESAEYYYRSRTTYNGQITGKHTLTNDALDWNVGYSYANRRLPDRRRYLIDDALESGTLGLSTGNDISREFTKLDEHIGSASINDSHEFHFGKFEPKLKLGAYGEYRSRKYRTRQFMYGWNTADNSLPQNFRTMDMTTLLSTESYFGDKGLYMLEHVDKTNDYSGHNTLGAGYLAMSLPFGKLSVYAGVRFEYNRMELISNTYIDKESPSSRYYTDKDLFPSINTTYKINDKHQVRLSYGKSVNRPEFREVSSSVYYDFDLASNVQGNTELKSCYIHNVDLRYEFYPSKGEQITLAGFYKRFENPIEWTYTVAGGTDLVYSYMNAKSADNLGVELDIRKNLAFIGLSDFSWSFNGSLIHSRVNFPKGSKEENRPMQGQSPYLVNTGFFYANEKLQLNVSLLYNRIGKRIIGVGRNEGTTGDNETARIPDSYEMPRDVIDLTMTKKFGSHWELKANIRDILAQKVSYKQFAETKNGEIEEITRQYKPGRNIGISATYKF